jgi:hypothetical protein
MSRYRIDDSDRPFAAEFLANPVGYHSPGLQRVLNVLRGSGPAGKYVLIVKEPYRRWGLGRLPGRRGAPVEVLEGVEYTDLDEAERDIFRRRWKDATGSDLT